MPVRLSNAGEIHRRLRFGTLADLSMLDLRSCRPSSLGDGSRRSSSDHHRGGADGLVIDGLAASPTGGGWVGNSVMISRLDVGTLPAWLLGPLAEMIGLPNNGFALNPDQWHGYNADRQELISFLRTESIDNVVFLTGDIHSSWATAPAPLPASDVRGRSRPASAQPGYEPSPPRAVGSATRR